jgi:hypothetical protein
LNYLALESYDGCCVYFVDATRGLEDEWKSKRKSIRRDGNLRDAKVRFCSGKNSGTWGIAEHSVYSSDNVAFKRWSPSSKTEREGETGGCCRTRVK